MNTDLIKYFGNTVFTSKIEEKPSLPLYLSNREMHRVEIDGAAFLLVKIHSEENFGAMALKKQLFKYIESFQCNVAFSFESITRVQRDALLKNRIPFIALPGQVFLPFLGVILNDSFKKQKHVDAKKMMPATQQLLLLLLYKKDQPILKSTAADILGLTRTSITRASDQLEAMGLIEQQKNGKEIHMYLRCEAAKTLELAQPFLINPVRTKVIINRNELPKTWFFAGETALSTYSMLNEPKITEVAVYKEDINLKEINKVDPRWEDADSVVTVELWKYNPAFFATSNIVDPISLACSLMDCEDERVEMCVAEMIGGVHWQ